MEKDASPWVNRIKVNLHLISDPAWNVLKARSLKGAAAGYDLKYPTHTVLIFNSDVCLKEAVRLEPKAKIWEPRSTFVFWPFVPNLLKPLGLASSLGDCISEQFNCLVTQTKKHFFS